MVVGGALFIYIVYKYEVYERESERESEWNEYEKKQTHCSKEDLELAEKALSPSALSFTLKTVLPCVVSLVSLRATHTEDERQTSVETE